MPTKFYCLKSHWHTKNQQLFFNIIPSSPTYNGSPLLRDESFCFCIWADTDSYSALRMGFLISETEFWSCVDLILGVVQMWWRSRLGEGGEQVRDRIKSKKSKKSWKPKLTKNKTIQNHGAKMLEKNNTIVLRGNNRHGPEISYRTELKKVLPNGTFPEVQGGWELWYLHLLASDLTTSNLNLLLITLYCSSFSALLQITYSLILLM